MMMASAVMRYIQIGTGATVTHEAANEYLEVRLNIVRNSKLTVCWIELLHLRVPSGALEISIII